MRKLTKLIGVALIATSMMASFTGCSGLYNQIDELEKELAEEKAKNDKLTEEKADLQDQIALLTGEQKALKELQDKLNELIKTSDVDKTTIESLTNQITELEAEIDELTDKLIIALNNASEVSDDEKDKIINDYRNQLDAALTRIEILEQVITGLTNELEETRDEAAGIFINCDIYICNKIDIDGRNLFPKKIVLDNEITKADLYNYFFDIEECEMVLYHIGDCPMVPEQIYDVKKITDENGNVISKTSSDLFRRSGIRNIIVYYDVK